LSTYTTLEATTKIKQLQIMLQNTTANTNSPIIIQNSFLDVLTRASHGLTVHFKDILELADNNQRNLKLNEFQGMQ
jgi:hypothetical protein